MSEKRIVDANVFGNQVVELLAKCEKLKAENAQLRQNLAKVLADLEDAKLKITELNTNYARLKLAKTYGWDEKSKREAIDRISKLVRDIDKCLGLLNEID